MSHSKKISGLNDLQLIYTFLDEVRKSRDKVVVLIYRSERGARSRSAANGMNIPMNDVAIDARSVSINELIYWFETIEIPYVVSIHQTQEMQYLCVEFAEVDWAMTGAYQVRMLK